MAEIDIWLASPEGTRVLPLAHYDRATYTRAINDVGELKIVLPGHFDMTLVQPDSLIFLYRDGRLDTETAWLVQLDEQTTPDPSVRSVTFEAVSGTQLLSRRIVAAAKGSAAAHKSGPADDLIKAYAREQLGSSAGNRALSSSLFRVAADTSQGATVSEEADYKNLLDACQDIAKASTEAGTALFFDVVWLADSSLWELRTYTGQRGVDKSRDTAAPQTLSVERGSIGMEQLTNDYRDEVTAVYLSGPGNEDARLVVTAVDTVRAGRSPYGRRETFASASADEQSRAQSEADAVLQRNRPRRTYVAEVISNANTEYGRDYTFGDIVTVEAYGMVLDCRIDAVSMTIDNLDGGRETVRVRLTNVADLP